MNLQTLLDRIPGPRRRLGWIGVGATLLVLALLWVAVPRRSANFTSYYQVRRNTLTISIIEPGSLAAVSEVSVRNEVEGTARIIYIVPEGTFVKKDDLLVELDSAQAEDQVNQQRINSEKAQFGLIQAQEQLAIQKSAIDSDIRGAELKLKIADLDLQKFDRGQQLVDLVEASNKLVQAEALLAVNLDTYNWTTNLASRGYETKQRVDADRLSVLNNRNSVIVASNSIWMLNTFDIPKQRELFVSTLRESSNELHRVIAQGRAKLAQAEADLLTQSNTLSLSLRKLDRDENNLKATKRYAPQDGLVVYAVGEGRFSSESLIEEGAVIRNRQELIKLPDTSRMKVTVRVHESHINMIRAGLPAFVMLEPMPDVRFAGVVDRVGLLPDTQSRWANPNLKVYNTEVYITDPLPDVKPGVSAKAEIIITNILDTLSVPIQAVTTLNGRQVVYTVNGGRSEPRPVEVGLYNTKFIQVISGLNEGDRVLLSPPFDTHEKDLEGELLSPEEKAKVVVTNQPPRAAPTTRPDRSAAPSRETSTSIPGPRDSAPAATASTGAGPTDERTGGGDRSGGRGRLDPQAMTRSFDADGDGQLSETERNAMRAAVGGRQGGSGTPGRQGAQSNSRGGRQEIMKQFDKDGDGQLNDDERAAMRQAFPNSRGGGGARPDPAGGGQDSSRSPARPNRDESVDNNRTSGGGSPNPRSAAAE